MNVVGRGAAGPSVCPFVALAEDRNRRADAPDKGNRCYAEPAPRLRDLSYQHDFCYSRDFATCSVFLAWAARNAAEPAYVTEAAQRAWASGVAAPEDIGGESGARADADTTEAEPTPTPEDGLFGPPSEEEMAASSEAGWVSASAWADVPWDERAEAEAEELEALDAAESEDELEDVEPDDERTEEATTGPKVPAALPMRRRRTAQRPIRTRGSGEWFYADPLGHEPLVRRRYGIGAPILLGVLGLLIVALIVFMLPTLLSGGGSDTAALPSASPEQTTRPVVTRPPALVATPGPSVSPSPEPITRFRTYRVKAGDSLTGIAERFNVRPVLIQCLNGITNRNVVVLGARYLIPPDGFTCWPGWRSGATPPPDHPAANIEE